MVVLGKREAARFLERGRGVNARTEALARPKGLAACLEMTNPGTFGTRHAMKRVLTPVLRGNLPKEELSALCQRSDKRESLGAMGVAAAELMKLEGLTGMNAAKMVGQLLPSVGDGGSKQLTKTLIAVVKNNDVSFSIVSDAVKLLAKLYPKADSSVQASMKRAVRNAEFEGRAFPGAVEEFNQATKEAKRRSEVVMDVVPEPAMR